MKVLRFLCLLLVIIAISCKKENANRNPATVNTTPKSIIYQLYDTSIRNYVTYQSYKLFRDSGNLYFDSVYLEIDNIYYPDNKIIFNHSMYNSNNWLLNSNTTNFDSSQVSIIRLNNGRIAQIDLSYNLLTNETYVSEQNTHFEYANFLYGTPILTKIYDSLLVQGNVSGLEVVNASKDSMKIVQERQFDYIGNAAKYTVIFDSIENNTNLLQLSGYIIGPSGYNPYLTNQNFGFGIIHIGTFSELQYLPFPNLNMKLAKSIYITQYYETEMYEKYVDYTYEFDTENRVKVAHLKYYNVKSNYNYYETTENEYRILFNY